MALKTIENLFEAANYFMESDTGTDPTDVMGEADTEETPAPEGTEAAPEAEAPAQEEEKPVDENESLIAKLFEDFEAGRIKEFINFVKKGKNFAAFVDWAIDQNADAGSVQRIARIVKES